MDRAEQIKSHVKQIKEGKQSLVNSDQPAVIGSFLAEFIVWKG